MLSVSIANQCVIMTANRQLQALDAIEEINLEDETIRALLPGYVKRRRHEIATLQQHLDKGEYNEIRIIGHNLKGSGGLYGLPFIGELGGQIEKHAQANDHNQLSSVFTQLANFLENLNI